MADRGGRIEALYYELGMRTEGMDAGKAKAAAILRDLDVIAAKTGKSIDDVAAAANRSGAGEKGLHAVATSLSDVSEKGEKAGLSLHGFLRPLESLATESISANAQVGNLASKLATLGLGTGLTLVILAGIAIIAKAWDLFTESTRKAKKAIDDTLASLDKAREARQQGTVGFAAANVDVAISNEAEKLKALQTAQAGTVTTVRPGIHETVVDLSAVKKAQDELTTASERTIEANQALADVQQTGAEKESSRLGRLLVAQKANSAEIARAAGLIKQYQAEFDSITGIDERSEERKSQLLGMIDDLTAASKKEGESSKTLLDQQTQVRQAFAQMLAAQTPDKADDFKTSIDRLVAAAQKAHLGATEIANMVQQLQTAHTKALTQEAADLAKQMQAELAKATGLQADALKQGLDVFDQQVKDAVNRGVLVDPQLASKLRDAKVEAIGLAEAADELSQHLVQIDHNSAQGFGFLDSMKLLLDDLDRANADFDSAKSAGDVAGMAAAQQRINTILGAQKRLQDEIAALIKEQADETVGLTQKIAGSVAAIANVAFGLASAFAGANSELTKMLGSIGQAAGGVDALMKIANTKDANGNAPGLGGIFSSASGLLSAAPALGQIIGGAIGLASSLFGKSPEEQHRQEVQRQNTEALRQLTERIGDLGKINVTGTQLDQLQKFFAGGILNVSEPGGVLAGIAPQFNNGLKAAGLSMQELANIAEQFGIKFADTLNPTFDELRKLSAAIQASELTQFGDTFEGQLSQFNAAVNVFNLTKPIDQFNALRKSIAGISGGGGALQKLLDTFDLTTEKGVNDAIAALQNLFLQLQTLTPDQAAAFLGGLTPQQFEQLIEQTIGIVKAQGGASGVGGTGGFNVDRTITEVTGSRLAALLSTDVIWNQQTAENTAKMLGLMTGVAPPLIGAPSLPSIPNPKSGPSVVIGDIVVNVSGLTDASRAQDIGKRVGGAVLDEIDRGLASRSKWNARAKGIVGAKAI